MRREREFVVVEPMRTANIFYVMARTRFEAIEKVKRNEHDRADQGDVLPVRPLRVRDAHFATDGLR